MHTSEYRPEKLSPRAKHKDAPLPHKSLRSVDEILAGLPGGYLLREMLLSWRVFVVAIAVSIVVAVLLLLIITKNYTAAITVAPSPQGSRDSTASISSSLLQNLPGLRGDPSASVSPYLRFLSGVTSYNVAARLQKKYNFLQSIYADQWDSQSKKWREPSGILASIRADMKLALGYPKRPPGPDIEDLQAFIKKHLSVDTSETSSIRALEFTYKDRGFADRFLIALVQETDDAIRSEARNSAYDYSAYLNKALAETSTAEVRLALATLVLEQQRRIMTISGGQPYAAIIIDGPYVSHSPNPNPILALALCVLLGVLTAAGIVMLRTLRRQNPAREGVTVERQ